MEAFMLKRIAGLILVTMTLAACNTIAGAGRDIERGGEKLQNQAHETQLEMRQQRY
jgi:predicted small secreted protein